ncbi:MAG: hypothetical protein M3Q58_10195 [Bacteroidota bacterium]|nr:hypothetical protein [Bacteroidota bacterium]
MEKLFFIAALILIQFSFFNLKAQEVIPETQQYKHAIGAAAGFTTGYGLAYRFTPNKFGIQFAFGPFADEFVTLLSGGLTFMYYIILDQTVNFFLYQGNHYLYRHSKEYFYENDPGFHFPEPELRWVTQNRVNNGLGFGFDFNIGKRISWNIMSGYAAYNNFNKFSLTGETSLFFKF